MKNKRITAVLAATLAAAATLLPGCEETEIPTWKSSQYVHFVNYSADTVSFTFMLHPDRDEYELAIPVALIGSPADRDQTYSVIAIDSLSDAVAGTHYELPHPAVFRTGRVTDSLYVTLKLTEDMKTHAYRLAILLMDNENFRRGPTDYLITYVKISNKVAKPAWWSSNVTTYYLGKYSDKKFDLFIRVTGVIDMTGMSTSEMREYALQFTYWLMAQDTPVLEDNGSRMTTPMSGTTI